MASDDIAISLLGLAPGFRPRSSTPRVTGELLYPVFFDQFASGNSRFLHHRQEILSR
jgi:hypothetical protein